MMKRNKNPSDPVCATTKGIPYNPIPRVVESRVKTIFKVEGFIFSNSS